MMSVEVPEACTTCYGLDEIVTDQGPAGFAAQITFPHNTHKETQGITIG
jgi:hypothetical protein